MSIKLDDYEKDILRSYENDEWVSVDNIEEEKKRHMNIAKDNMKKNKRINIRVTQKDLNDIKKRALLEGIPYQTLISSIIHKYNNGLLIEKKYL